MFNLGSTLLWVEALHSFHLCCILGWNTILAIAGSLQLFVVVKLILSHLIRVLFSSLFFILIHYLKINSVVHLESSHFDFLFPHLVMKLNVVQDGINKSLDVWIFVAKEFKYNRDHLSLMQNNIPCWCEE